MCAVDDGERSDQMDVGQGFKQKSMHARATAVRYVTTAVLRVTEKRFLSDAVNVDNIWCSSNEIK